MLFAVINVTNAPLLFHAYLLNASPQVRARLRGGGGDGGARSMRRATTRSPLISFQMASYINGGYAAAGRRTARRACCPAPVGDLFVLDSVEVPAVVADVNAYNTYIKAKADYARLGVRGHESDARRAQGGRR